MTTSLSSSTYTLIEMDSDLDVKKLAKEDLERAIDGLPRRHPLHKDLAIYEAPLLNNEFFDSSRKVVLVKQEHAVVGLIDFYRNQGVDSTKRLYEELFTPKVLTVTDAEKNEPVTSESLKNFTPFNQYEGGEYLIVGHLFSFDGKASTKQGLLEHIIKTSDVELIVHFVSDEDDVSLVEQAGFEDTSIDELSRMVYAWIRPNS